MNVLVTGGAGFIGSHVVDELLQRGHEVRVIDDLSAGSPANLEGCLGNGRFLGLLRGDTRVPQDMLSAAKGMDAVVHLAAAVSVTASLIDPREFISRNTYGTLTVLETCRAARIPLVLVSTCMVYAGGPDSISEASPLLPRSPYAASKLAAEEVARAFSESYGVPVTIVRPFNTYGPRQRSDAEGGVIPFFLKNSGAGSGFSIYGDGEQTRDFMYVADCAKGIALTLERPGARGETLNLGTGRETSVNELARLIGPKNAPSHLPHIHPQCEILRMRCDYAKAQEFLGWEPCVGLESGLRLTKEWLDEHSPSP